MFSNSSWCGTLFPRNARADGYLTHYAAALNTVEGNNTFYGLPRAATIARWAEQIPETFRFCFKFPRSVSHDGLLTSSLSMEHVAEFLKTLRPIRDNIGVLLLQLSPRFDGPRLDELDRFLDSLPTDWDYAVEPRHADFFEELDYEQRFDELLAERHISRCLFDTVLLHSVQSDAAGIREAQRKKPNFPERWTVTSDRPFVRFVGDESARGNATRLCLVAEKVASWIEEEKTPYVFLHTPSDDDVPELCRSFHQLMIEQLSIDAVGEMPDWPGELGPKQMSLF